MTYPLSPGYQATDTSKAAADHIAPDLNRIQLLALAQIRQAGERGMTADECAEALHMWPFTVRPRCTELGRKGIIRDSGKRRKNVTGRMAIVWVVV